MHPEVAAAQRRDWVQHVAAKCAGMSVLIAGVVTDVAPVATAHDAVVGGSPANGAVVEQFPARLELEFSGQPKEGFNTFALSHVTDSGSEVLYSGEPTVDGRRVSLELPEGVGAGPGEYRIGFQIISSDGHTTKGMTSFTYSADPSEELQAEPRTSNAPEAGDGIGTAESGEDSDSGSSLRIVLGIVGIITIAGAALAALGRQRRVEQTENRDILDSPDGPDAEPTDR